MGNTGEFIKVASNLRILPKNITFGIKRRRSGRDVAKAEVRGEQQLHEGGVPEAQVEHHLPVGHGPQLPDVAQFAQERSREAENQSPPAEEVQRSLERLGYLY